MSKSLGTALFTLVGLGLVISNDAAAQPSGAQCVQLWNKNMTPELAKAGEKAMACTPKGGKRATKEHGGKHYLTDIATCWDYDLVGLKKCGCRLFKKASICCRKGQKECEFRIGDSEFVDCKKYKLPTYGLAGETEPKDCKEKRLAGFCFKKRDGLAGVNLRTRMTRDERGKTTGGPCPIFFDCKGGPKTAERFDAGECALAEECDCTVSECNEETTFTSYEEFKKDKAAQACWKKSRKERDTCFYGLQ